MSVQNTTTSTRPPQSPRPRLSAHAKTVLRGRYLAKNTAEPIVEIPAQLFWRVATDIAHAERLYPAAGRLPPAAQHHVGCKGLTVFRAGNREQQVFSCSPAHPC